MVPLGPEPCVGLHDNWQRPSGQAVPALPSPGVGALPPGLLSLAQQESCQGSLAESRYALATWLPLQPAPRWLGDSSCP